MTPPAMYLTAEAAARPELDRPDHAALEQLLALDVKAAGELVAATPDETNLALREALPRAARIVNPNAYVPIANYPPNVDALMAAIESTDPILRRFAAAQYFIDAPRQDTSWGKPLPDFPAELAPDGEIVYVPYSATDPSNVTVESVAKADAGGDQPPVAPVPVTPKIVSVLPPVLADPANGITAQPAVVTVQTQEGFFQHIGDDIHAAIESAIAWIKKISAKL